MLERNNKLLNKKLVQYLIPSILIVFAMQFASLADGIFIANTLGNDILTATSLVTPLLFIIQLPGLALGVGGAIVVANYLGKREISKAKKAFSLSIILATAVSVVFAIIGPFISTPLAKLFTPDYYEPAAQFLLIYFVTDPILTLTTLLASLIAVDNSPKLASIICIVGNVVKVATEIPLINAIGVYGAALSTGLGFFAGLLLLPFYFKSKNRLLSLTFKFNVKEGILGELLKTSSSTILNYLLTAVQMSVINIFISRLITNGNELLVFGMVANMVFVFDLLIGGVIQIVPNICGVLFGEKDYYSLRKITRSIFLITIGITIVLGVIILVFPGVYCAIFAFDYAGIEELTFNILRLYVISFLPYEINKFIQAYYPTIKENIPSIVCVLCREAIIVIPLTIVMLNFYGLTGYSIAQTINESATVLITVIFLIAMNIKHKRKGYGLLHIPNSKSEDNYDVTVSNELDNVSELSEEVNNYAKQHKVDERNSYLIALAAEEMVANTITYGYKFKTKNYIDVSLKIVEGKLILRIRDDGLPFDPTKYQEEEKEFSTSGIMLVKTLIESISYIRVLHMNYTILEIQL